ncbi:MAG: glycoside hydrolase family 3 protein [Candidatus Dormibacteraeota bacterium]|nr:glycoside hydrolase family 3 protein [Candidatus Dormibacteraeota bacterium]
MTIGRRRRLVTAAWGCCVATIASACGAASPSPRAHGTTTRTASTTTAATPTPCSVSAILSTWSDLRLAEQTIVVPVDETQVATVAPEIAAGAGGVILFGSTAPADLGSQLQALDSGAPGGLAPLVMSDEEGGAVQRMANLAGAIPAARQMGASMTAAQIQELALNLATRLHGAGVTMDLAPVLDTDDGAGPNNTDPDGTRSFSNDPAVASADGRAFAAGLTAGGVVPVVKHFPGLGHATGNTDVMSAATVAWSTLQTGGLIPFRDAITAQVPAVMVANATIPGLSTIPASLSPDVITTELRTQLGFHGLVLTDSLSAVAIQNAGYSVPQAAVAAITAGADMILFNASAADVGTVSQSIASALLSAEQGGTLPRDRLVDAAMHVLTAKGTNLCAG